MVDSGHKTVLLVVGARPNFMKAAALWRAAASYPHLRLLLVNTGQHYDHELSGIFLEQFGMPEPHFSLGIGSGTHAEQTGRIMISFEPVVRQVQPDLTMVVGDVNSTIACALVSVKLGIPVAHVEAGLRSFDWNMPEEINRILTDAISAHLFATEPSAVTNLRREGVGEDRIHLVGNVMIDTLRQFLPLAECSRIHEVLDLRPNGKTSAGPYAVVTLHRPSNVDDDDRLRDLVLLLEEVSQLLPVVFPVHPRTRRRMEHLGYQKHRERAGCPLILTTPLGYLDFLALLKDATVVLTDSGGIQEETTALGVPCLTLRENTERPITVTVGTNQVVGRDRAGVINAVSSILHGMTKKGRTPPLWDGSAAARIWDILVERLRTGAPHAPGHFARDPS